MPDWARQRQAQVAYPTMVTVAQNAQELDALAALDDLSPEQEAAARDAVFQVQLALAN